MDRLTQLKAAYMTAKLEQLRRPPVIQIEGQFFHLEKQIARSTYSYVDAAGYRVLVSNGIVATRPLRMDFDEL